MERLNEAAAVFEQAYVAVTRALLSLGAGGSRQASLAEMGAAFQALAGVLETLAETPEPESLVPAVTPPRERARRL
ncbi:MAG: hypothetical protein HY321_19890 [Armatimonadetes bacterium]|nr:hypothetical protein [Armatimonadota bacterium]